MNEIYCGFEHIHRSKGDHGTSDSFRLRWVHFSLPLRKTLKILESKLKMFKRKFESFFRFFRPSTHKTKSSFIFIIQISSLFLLSRLLFAWWTWEKCFFFSFAIYSPSSHMGIINLALLIFLQPKTISLICVCICLLRAFWGISHLLTQDSPPLAIIIFSMVKSTVKVYAFLLQISLVLFLELVEIHSDFINSAFKSTIRGMRFGMDVAEIKHSLYWKLFMRLG